MSDDFRWHAMLDEFERRAHDATGEVPLGLPTNTPVAGIGLPVELAERAAVVVVAQARAIALLRKREEQLRDQLRVLEDASVPTTPPAPPVYVDIVG